MAGFAVAAAIDAFGRDRVFRRAQRKTRVVVEHFIFAHETQSSTELTGSAGVGDQLEASDTGGKLRLDDLDRRDLGVGLIDVGAGHAVFAAPAAGAAAEDFILHVAFAGLVAAPADDDRAAAAAVADFLMRRDLARCFEQRLHQCVNGRIVGVYRRGEARIDDAALRAL